MANKESHEYITTQLRAKIILPTWNIFFLIAEFCENKLTLGVRAKATFKRIQESIL